MKPIGLKKNNVVHLVHEGTSRVRLATQQDMARTLASPSGFGWPTCWRCTEAALARGGPEGKFCAVEGYGILDERENEEDLQAECSHGTGRTYREVKVLTMPRGWSKLKKAHKRSSLVFFMSSTAEPLGNLVMN